MLAQMGLRMTPLRACTLPGTESGSVKTRLSSYDARVSAALLIDWHKTPVAAEHRMVRTGTSPADLEQRQERALRKLAKLAIHKKSTAMSTLTTVTGIRLKP